MSYARQTNQTDQARPGPRPRTLRRGEESGRGRRRRVLLGATAVGAAGLAGAAWWWHSTGASASDTDVQEAAALAGVPASAIQPVTGGIHVIYHATTPLPSPAQPRADGKLTLLWFSASW